MALSTCYGNQSHIRYAQYLYTTSGCQNTKKHKTCVMFTSCLIIDGLFFFLGQHFMSHISNCLSHDPDTSLNDAIGNKNNPLEPSVYLKC